MFLYDAIKTKCVFGEFQKYRYISAYRSPSESPDSSRQTIISKNVIWLRPGSNIFIILNDWNRLGGAWGYKYGNNTTGRIVKTIEEIYQYYINKRKIPIFINTRGLDAIQ